MGLLPKMNGSPIFNGMNQWTALASWFGLRLLLSNNKFFHVSHEECLRCCSEIYRYCLVQWKLWTQWATMAVNNMHSSGVMRCWWCRSINLEIEPASQSDVSLTWTCWLHIQSHRIYLPLCNGVTGWHNSISKSWDRIDHWLGLSNCVLRWRLSIG